MEGDYSTISVRQFARDRFLDPVPPNTLCQRPRGQRRVRDIRDRVMLDVIIKEILPL